MKKSIIVLLVLAILAGIGLTSCKNEVQAPVDELVSISFGYDSSRALTASLQEFDVDDYYWFYESEKADGSGLKSGQTGAGLTDLSSENAMATVLGNALPANCGDNGPEKGLENPVEGFSKGLWNFRLFAVTVEYVYNENTQANETVYHPVYIGEAHSVLIDNDHHTVKVVVSPFSADYQIGEEYGYLKIGNIQFKEASSQSSVTAGALTITDKVSSYNSSAKKWEEVSRAPVNGKFTLLGGTYLYERIYSLGVSEITRGSVLVTVYPNLTTTVSGFVTELTTSFGFETSENPDVVNVSAEATIAYNDTTHTSDTYTLAVDGQDVSKVEAEITKDAADDLIEELTGIFAQTDSSIADIDLDHTSTSMNLNLGVRTTATTAESVAYDINMTAVVTYGEGTSAKAMTADVKTVPDYVMVTVNMQSGVSVTSVTHSGKKMKAVSDIDKAGTSESTEDGAGVETADADGIYVGFYKYDSVYNKLYIKTRSFSPFVVNYKYVESDSMAKVIRYVADKSDITELSHASITSAEVDILELKSELKKIMKVLPAMDFSVNPNPKSDGYPAGAYNDILNAIQTGTFVTFMPKFDAAGKTAGELPESDAYYSGGKINTIEGWGDYQNTEFSGWRTDFRVVTNDDFKNGDFYLVGHYVIGNIPLGPVPITDISDLVEDGYMDVMKQLGGDYLVIPYDLLLGLCSTEDGVRHGFNCGAYAVSSNAYGKKITVQLILTNDNLIKEGEEPETVVCAEVVCAFHAPDADQNALMSAVINQLDDSKQLLIHKDSDGTNCSNDMYMSLADFRDSVNKTGKYYDEGDSTKFCGYTYSGYTVTLQCDIDLDNEPWTPIGSKSAHYAFSGTFDGNGKVIRNLYFNDDTKSDANKNIGFFGLVENAVIENLKVSGKITAHATAAGIVARAVGSTTIENVTNDVDVAAWDKVGGIVGAAYSNWTSADTAYNEKNREIRIINCTNMGDITCLGQATDYTHKVAGAIVGHTAQFGKTICEGCTNSGEIKALAIDNGNVVGSGSPRAGFVIGTCSNNVNYNPEGYNAGVYIYNCTDNTNLTVAVASVDGTDPRPIYGVYVKYSQNEAYVELENPSFNVPVYFNGEVYSY